MDLLPGQRDDFFGKIQVVSQILLAFLIDEEVEPLPVENELDHASVFEGSEEHPDLDKKIRYLDVGNIEGFMRVAAELFLNCHNSLLEQIPVNSLAVLLLNLNHSPIFINNISMDRLISNILLFAYRLHFIVNTFKNWKPWLITPMILNSTRTRKLPLQSPSPSRTLTHTMYSPFHSAGTHRRKQR